MEPKEVSKRLLRIAHSIETDEHPKKDIVISSLNEIQASIKVAQTPQEGLPAAPLDQIITHLGTWLTAKYTIDAAYRSYADRVRGPWRDALVDHWYKHAKEERKQGYDLAMKIVALGGDPIQTVIEVPAAETSLGAFCAQLSALELKAIENGRIAIQLAGDDAPIRVLAEQLIYTDSQHLDDLRRWSCDLSDVNKWL